MVVAFIATYTQIHIHTFTIPLLSHDEWMVREWVKDSPQKLKVVKKHTQMSETHKCNCTFAHGHLRERRRGRVILREFN